MSTDAVPVPKKTRPGIVRRLALALVTFCIVLLVLEAALRIVFPRNADGNVIVHGRTLQPFRPPVEALRGEVEIYNSTKTRMMADPDLGWTLRPSTLSADRLYACDAGGARSATSAVATVWTEAPAGVLRIVLLGDSFTYGAEVAFEDTWGFLLEKALGRRGVRVEVDNLGVPAYGVDQAFLRWKATDSLLGPAVVVLGLQMENVHRTVNILRPLYVPAGHLPFSKPRARLTDGRLDWVNVPAMGPAEVLATLQHLDAWALSPLERFMPLPGGRAPAWSGSRTLALAHEILFPIENDPSFYDPEGEPGRLALALLQELDCGVTARGGRFLVVHIPILADLVQVRLGRSLPYQALWDVIRSRHRAVGTLDALRAAAAENGLRALFMPEGHYSAIGNRAIAEVAYTEIAAMLADPGDDHEDGGTNSSSSKP